MTDFYTATTTTSTVSDKVEPLSLGQEPTAKHVEMKISQSDKNPNRPYWSWCNLAFEPDMPFICWHDEAATAADALKYRNRWNKLVRPCLKKAAGDAQQVGAKRPLDDPEMVAAKRAFDENQRLRNEINDVSSSVSQVRDIMVELFNYAAKRRCSSDDEIIICQHFMGRLQEMDASLKGVVEFVNKHNSH